MRLLEFMGAAARLDEASRSDLERLKASLRRLAAQLNAMHRPTTSIASLEAAGKWAEHELVQEKVRAEANAVLTASESASQREPRLARRVHDALLSTLVTVDCAPNRPGCLRKLKTPGSQSPCECGADGCRGNRFDGVTMVLVHSKTARFRSSIVVDFAGTLTERLLQHHLAWGRALLLARDADTDSVWISTRGHAFGSDESFGAYLPRILSRLDLPHLSFTTLRHAAVVAASEWASEWAGKNFKVWRYRLARACASSGRCGCKRAAARPSHLTLESRRCTLSGLRLSLRRAEHGPLSRCVPRSHLTARGRGGRRRRFQIGQR